MTEAEDVERATRQPHEREPRAAGSEGAATFGHYMVGVFDICGQSRKLRQEAGIPLSDDGVELQRIIANLKDTAGVVIGFRRLFRGFFGAASHTRLAWRTLYQNLNGPKCWLQRPATSCCGGCRTLFSWQFRWLGHGIPLPASQTSSGHFWRLATCGLLALTPIIPSEVAWKSVPE